MATGTGPNLATTPRAAAGITNATLDTSRTAPTNFTTIFTAGSNGSRINMVRINQVATTAGPGCLNLFLYDGTTYHLWDVYVYTAVTLSTTSEALPVDVPYAQLVLPSGWSLRVTDTVTASAWKVIALGGDF